MFYRLSLCSGKERDCSDTRAAIYGRANNQTQDPGPNLEDTAILGDRGTGKRQEMRETQAKDAGGVATQPDPGLGPPLRADPGPGVGIEGKMTTVGSLTPPSHVT